MRVHAIGSTGRLAGILAVLSLMAVSGLRAEPVDPVGKLAALDDYPHAQSVTRQSAEVVDHEIGLGALRKSGGAWRFKASERVSGLLERHTWQIVDGFTSLEVSEELETWLLGIPGSFLLFSCDARSCGPGVQWANRVFGERLLYGREDQQRYRVYSIEGDVEYRVVLYSSARTADRQYLHVDLVTLAAQLEE